MAAGSKAREILNYTFLVALANDGIIDDSELSHIRNLALMDGKVDEKERLALRKIFALIDEANLSPAHREEYRKFRVRYGV
jgi:tellurite resistance protein